MNALLLSQILGEVSGKTPTAPLTADEFSADATAIIERFKSQDRPEDYADYDKFHRWIFRYALKMADVSYRRLLEPAPAPDPELLERFVAAVTPYPEASREHFQGSVDPASSIRRAMEVQNMLQDQDNPAILCMGDDDATSVALAMLGEKNVTALDIDERIITWLQKAAQEVGVTVETCTHDLRELPDSFKGGFAAVVTDPTPDFALARFFLKAAHSCLKPRGFIFWADHPDWNVHCDSHVQAAAAMGLKLHKVFENYHTYKATVYDDTTAEHLNVSPDWIRRLAAQIRVWSHLYVFCLES